MLTLYCNSTTYPVFYLLSATVAMTSKDFKVFSDQWSKWEVTIPLPSHPKCDALPIELHLDIVVGGERFELPAYLTSRGYSSLASAICIPTEDLTSLDDINYVSARPSAWRGLPWQHQTKTCIPRFYNL